MDLQSVHAGACSTKVGLFGKKSSPGRLQEAISEMLASFWGSFGSTLPLFGRPRAHLSLHGIFITIFMIFSGQRAPPSPPQRDICGKGSYLWGQGKTSLRHYNPSKAWGKQHLGKIGLSGVVRRGEKG